MMADQELELPDFTAYEINELRKRAVGDSPRGDYYKKCLEIVEKHDSGTINYYTEKMSRWLWGIKADLGDV